MISPTEKAAILIEALPYIQKFFGKTVVIKLGGHAMLNSELEKLILQDIILMKLVGMNPVIIHGGGPEINYWLQKTGKKTKFVHGLRVTDKHTIELVEMVLSGNINQRIVQQINNLGGRAIGISGKDAQLIQTKKKRIASETELGFVGEIEEIKPEIIELLSKQDLIPVISPLGYGLDGHTYNINADYAAGALSGALKAHKLVMLTDVEGIYLNQDTPTHVSQLTVKEIKHYLKQGIINGGMIPKVESCLLALEYGVSHVHIINGQKPHTLLLEIFTNQGIGTMIVPS